MEVQKRKNKAGQGRKRSEMEVIDQLVAFHLTKTQKAKLKESVKKAKEKNPIITNQSLFLRHFLHEHGVI